MKKFLLFLLCLSLSFSLYGTSRIIVERTWTIGAAEGDFIDFDGALAVNNTIQQVVAIESQPKADYIVEGDVVRIRYNGTMNGTSFVIKGAATVDIDYDTEIISDAPVPKVPLTSTNLTSFDGGIASQAQSLADSDSSLNTIANLVNWVHDYVTYDKGYSDKVKSAKDTFEEKQGACVQYTHLLIAMARSLGFETRYVSGYVFTDEWQPHTWAEISVPGYGWLPADPTLGQAGVLDNTHVALTYGDDQLSVYDVLTTKNEDSTLEVQDDIIMVSSSERTEDVHISIDFDYKTYHAGIILSNEGHKYLFGNYQFLAPESYGGAEDIIIVLKPGETTHRYYGLNHSLFNNSYSYNIPLKVSFNDLKAKKTIIVNGGSTQCHLPFMLLFLLSLKIFSG